LKRGKKELVNKMKSFESHSFAACLHALKAATRVARYVVCFHTKNPKFGYILEGLRMESFGIFYGRLVKFRVVGCILNQCGMYMYFVVIWYISSRFGMFNQEKSGKPGCDVNRATRKRS
jgi:hypothetical protein